MESKDIIDELKSAVGDDHVLTGEADNAFVEE